MRVLPDLPLDEQKRLFQAAVQDHHRRKQRCTAPGCDFGYVTPDPFDLDPLFEVPRREHCPACQGHGFVDRPKELA